MSRGFFLSFEGADGTGKSTQIRLLTRTLRSKGYRVLWTREPGGTKAGEHLRRILKREHLHPWSEVFILEASRRELVDRVIKPALASGQIVISDRFEDSTLVYQGLTKGLPLNQLRRLNALAVQGIRPQRVYLLSAAQMRLAKKSKQDKFDQASKAFHQKVQRGFLKLARSDRRFKIINASGTRMEIHDQIVQDLSHWLPRLRASK